MFTLRELRRDEHFLTISALAIIDKPIQKIDPEHQEFRDSSTSLYFRDIPLLTAPGLITCDVSKSIPRTFVPKPFRRQIFETLYYLSHSGKFVTPKLVTDRFIWPSCLKTIATWTEIGQACQRSKVDKHTKTALGTFPLPDFRFEHVHIHNIDPLPISNGFSYLLTRFYLWQDAFLCVTWLLSVPSTITTGRETQFESHLFSELICLARIG
ncbi:unnamed protein product [Hymenolepis diminuta]|uniref:Integrase zinc-binding domain-containing protein n=1 Tax=Hymenolepis diminuta TaxID=6216 RepID=A0A564XYC7_HYMDI|nr:unnamed protein product [Hymenolepis diminuta]